MNEYASKGLQDQLREEVFPWTLLLCAAAGVILAVFDPETVPPPSCSALGMLILAWVGIVWVVQRWHHRPAAWLLYLGSLCITLLAWHWYPNGDARHALLLPVIAASVTLGPGASCVVAMMASIILGLGMQLTTLRGNPSSFVANSAVLWSATLIVGLAQRPQRTAIAWAWRGYRQARENLEIARDRQLELKQVLEDLDLAHREVIRLNDLLTAAREAVEEARRAKEEFVANVSHELRTPLNMVIGFSDEILERPELYSEHLPTELLADVEVIKRNSEHLARLVDDVLDLVEADTGFTRLSKDWTSIEQVVRHAEESVSLFFERKGLQLAVDVPPDLPPVWCDHTRIRQVVLNLLSNAARFTERGGVRVGAIERDGMITVSVRDTGPGIEPETLTRLFEPFQRADASIRRRYGGTGLGLAISKRFVEMHGGRIWMESEVGVGTTVSFTLPLEEDLSALAPKRWFSPYHKYDPRDRSSLAPRTGPKPSVVVMEQGVRLSNLMEHYLDGLETTATKTVEEAFQAVQSEAATALVINEMPRANAPSSLADLPGMALDIPIVSCWVPEGEPATAQMGAQAYLVKPIRRSDLLGSIKQTAPSARRVLLVDDDEETRRLFTRMLSAANPSYSVSEAEDGESALTLMRKWRPDLVLLDLLMPNQDGFAVLATKASDGAIKDIPVIIISAKDPQREPIVSNALILTRQRGLSARNLVLSIEAIVSALPPRYGALAQHGTPAPLPASG